MRSVLVVFAVVLATPWLLPFAQAWPSDWDPNDVRNLTWEDEGVLARGGAPWNGLTSDDIRYLKQAGFGSIVNVRGERDDPGSEIEAQGLKYLYLPVDHAVDMNVTQVKQFVAWVEAQTASGKPVYVHCTNGMHRAAAFSVAWHMKQSGLSYDAAAKLVGERRPGTAMRAPAALLHYQAELTGKPALTVLLLSPVSRPLPGESMTAHVEVLDANGRPVPSASVRLWSEESRMNLKGTTDRDGRFAFTYTAPGEGVATDHVYARASAPGFLDGADNVEMFYSGGTSKSYALTITHAQFTEEGLVVKALRGSAPARARILATASDGSFAYDATGAGETTLPIPAGAGTVTVRVESWGATSATKRIEAPPAAPTDPGTGTTGNPPGPDEGNGTPATPTSGTGSNPPAQYPPPASPSRDAPLAWLAAVSGLGLSAALLGRRRRA